MDDKKQDNVGTSCISNEASYIDIPGHCVLDGFSYTVQTKSTIRQVTAMLATSKHVLFAGHNHMLTLVLMTRQCDYHLSMPAVVSR